MILPGVAITTWGRCASVCAWLIMSIPPTTTVHRTCKQEPRARNCSASWYASSLVGVITNAKTPYGPSERQLRIGRAKAAVFPLPVWARPRTSSPARIRGMQWRWTWVGFFMPSSAQVLTAHSASPRSEKLVDSESESEADVSGLLKMETSVWGCDFRGLFLL